MPELAVKGDLKPSALWQKKNQNVKMIEQWEKKAFTVTSLMFSGKSQISCSPFLGGLDAAQVQGGPLA